MIFAYEPRRLFMGIEDGGNRLPEGNDIPIPRVEKTPEQRVNFALETNKSSRDRIQTAENISPKFKNQDAFRRSAFERELLGTESSRQLFEQLLKPELQNILRQEPKRFDRPELQQAYEKAQDNFREFMKITKLNPEQQMAVWRKLKPMFSELAGHSQDSKAQAEGLRQAARFLESLKKPLNASVTSASDGWNWDSGNGIYESEIRDEVLDTLYLGDTGNAFVNQRRDQILAGNNQRFLGKTQAESALRVAITEYEQRNRADGQKLFNTFGLKPVDLLKAPPAFQQFLSRAENLADRGIGLANDFVKTQYLNETIKALQNGEPLSDTQKLALAVPNGIGAILKLPVSLPVALGKMKPLFDTMTVSEQRDEMFGQIGKAVEQYWKTSNKADKTALVIELGTSFVFFGWLIKSLKSPSIATEIAEEVEVAKKAGKLTVAEKGLETVNNAEVQRTISTISQQTEKLKPLQPFQGIEKIYEAAAKMKPQFDKTLSDFSKEFGVDVKLTALKGETRALEKVANLPEPPRTAERLTDILRGSLVGEDMRQLYPAVEAFLKRFDVIQVKDRFSKPFSDGYRDLLMNVRLENGLIAEVQFHLRPILEYTDKTGHKLYELNRAIITEYRAANLKLAQGKPLTQKELQIIEEFRAREALQISNYNKIWEESNR